jgi:mitogen-activated protein kinase kinase
LRKDPAKRPTYRELLVRISLIIVYTIYLIGSILQDHPFLVKDRDSNVDMVSWVQKALHYKATVCTQPNLPQAV